MYPRIPPSVLALGLSLFAFGCATTEQPKIAAEKAALRPVENPIPPNPAGVYDISKVTRAPIPRFQARPHYPFDLRRAGVSGEGIVSFIIDTEGNVVDAVVVQATDVRFGEAAVEAVLKWKFRPAELNGQVVPCHMTVPIVFSLDQR